jgi:hypothetical protein
LPESPAAVSPAPTFGWRACDLPSANQPVRLFGQHLEQRNPGDFQLSAISGLRIFSPIGKHRMQGGFGPNSTLSRQNLAAVTVGKTTGIGIPQDSLN